MKRVILTMVLAFFLSVNYSFAQSSAQPIPPQAEFKTILDYKSELGLTDSQVKSLQELSNRTRQYVLDKRKSMITLRSELRDLAAKKADLKSIRNKLEQISAVQVDLLYIEFETARKLENILTPSQLQKWNNIRKEFVEKLRATQETLNKADSTTPTKK